MQYNIMSNLIKVITRYSNLPPLAFINHIMSDIDEFHDKKRKEEKRNNINKHNKRKMKGKESEI